MDKSGFTLIKRVNFQLFGIYYRLKCVEFANLFSLCKLVQFVEENILVEY